MDGSTLEGSTGGEPHAAGTATASSSGATDGGAHGWSPSGLRVLVVDDDPMCLKVVSAMLQRCNYEVDTRSSGQDALTLLRERQEANQQFDLVLSDVYMPDMDGFKLLEHIGLELDLPVIMMSSNGDTDVVLRGVTHGAVDFLIKPVRVEELRNVWQHVVRRRSLHVPRAADELSGQGEGEGGVLAHGVKRKEAEALQVQHETQGANKKPRVVWSVEMHQQFVDAVNQLGVDKAVPKRILDLMNVEGLTRENVASHLQKYRLYLKRAQGLQNGKGAKGHKAAAEAAMLDPQAAAAAAAVAAGAGPSSVFAQVAAQQAAMGPGGMGMPHQPVPGMPPPGMPVMGMPGAMAAAAAWQQQTMAMQAAAAAAAASGALPGAMPGGPVPFGMPPGAMMPHHMAAMAAGMPMGMMGPAPPMPGMDGSGGFPAMMFGQQPPPPQPQQQQPQPQQQQPLSEAGRTGSDAGGLPAPSSSPIKQESAGVLPGFPATSAAMPSAASALTGDSGAASPGNKSGAVADDPVADLRVDGGLGDTEALMSALNTDSFLADVPLPRLDVDDFLDSFLTSDKGLGEGL